MTLLLFFFLFTTFVFIILNLLPVATTMPTEIANGLTLIVGYIKSWDGIFAFTHLLAAVAFMTVFFFALGLWYAVRWVIHLVRGGTS